MEGKIVNGLGVGFDVEVFVVVEGVGLVFYVGVFDYGVGVGLEVWYCVVDVVVDFDDFFDGGGFEEGGGDVFFDVEDDVGGGGDVDGGWVEFDCFEGVFYLEEVVFGGEGVFGRGGGWLVSWIGDGLDWYGGDFEVGEIGEREGNEIEKRFIWYFDL